MDFRDRALARAVRRFFPLVLVASWFPGAAWDLWLGKRSFAALASILAALLLFIAMARTPHVQMLLCLLAVAAFVLVASLFRNERQTEEKSNDGRATAFLFGMAGYPVLFLSPIILAAKRVSAPVYFLAVLTIFIVLAMAGRRAGIPHLPGAALLALGAYFSMSVFLFAGGMQRDSGEALVTGAIFAVFFLLLASGPVASLPPSEGVC